MILVIIIDFKIHISHKKFNKLHGNKNKTQLVPALSNSV